MSKTITLIDHPVTTAADLLTLIERLQAGGFDLSTITVTNGDGDPVGSMELEATTTNGSTVHNLSFWLG